MRLIRRFAAVALLLSFSPLLAQSKADRAFEKLAARYVDEMPAFSPVGATQLGDHRFDGRLDSIGNEARQAEAKFLRRYLRDVDRIAAERLSPANQVDRALLRHSLEAGLFNLEKLQSWAWNPMDYTGLTGGAIYGLMAREFAPLPERLGHVADRLEQLPDLLEQVRTTLVPARVPRIHAETAIRQNKGVLSILEHMVRPEMGVLAAEERQRLETAIAVATAAVELHQQWLEDEMLSQATADFRIGCDLFDEKLAFSLHTPMDRKEVKRRAEAEFLRVRDRMYVVATEIYAGEYAWTQQPAEPDDAYKQAIIRAALEVAYRDLPQRDAMIETAKQQLQQATDFVREADLVSVPDDPVEIIIMPEFQQGVSVAYCDSPGALDVGQKTFYAVSPIPEDWTETQVQSYLREYNVYSIQDLTIHEAMPGHYLQLALSNRYPSTLRSLLSSGTFIEGWAVYAEQLMADEGYNDNDPRQRLIALKWLLRAVTNAIMDQAIHCEGMTQDEAMRLMVEGGFQEEREAALKWVRAQLTSTQLSTYFVGYQEHLDLRREIEQAWGDSFSLRRFHDELLSFGSPGVQFVRALMLESEIPQ